jgi:hypothetical protein
MKRAGNLTAKQIQEILKIYPDVSAQEIANKYGKSVSHIYKIAYRYGIHKSEDFRNSSASGRIQKGQHLSPATELKKGNVPATKGKKLSEICKSKEALERTIARRWQKGHKPQTTKYDGAITIRRFFYKNNECTPYKAIRISEGNWEFLHRHLWQQAHGEIPRGYNIVFKDGNTLNCVLENLECISNAELATRNSIGHYPPELRPAVKLKNKILKKIKSYGKE